MNMTQSTQHSLAMQDLIHQIKSRERDIESWLQSLEGAKEFPFYSSVDIRDAGFKTSIVDTNIYPAGFNNVCEHGLQEAEQYFKKAILKRVPNCKNIVIVTEEHTRNTWYLENARILQNVITQAGFNVRVASFLKIQPSFCEKLKFAELETATGHNLRIYCFQNLLEDIDKGKEKVDMIILNNDLINGIPNVIKKSKIGIYPSIYAGWHSRLKSNHFDVTLDLVTQFSKIIQIDPWLLTCLHISEDQVNINEDNDRLRLSNSAEKLLQKVQQKYDQYHIKEKPYLVIKADAGTYGMGVMVFEDAAQIKDLNRKDRNKLFKGKGSKQINRYLIQEGVPTIYNLNNNASEICLYQVDNHKIGSFYRTNSIKGSRENLNTTGMEFHKICSHPEHNKDNSAFPEVEMFTIYVLLARIAAIAAYQEILQLEGVKK
jgi:glutamate--cysteine ligase